MPADREGPEGKEATDTGSERHIELEAIDPLSLDEALSILGDETRAAIVLELGEAHPEGAVTPPTLSFTRLMDRVGVEDSGLFNYHLEKLVGTFVKKTDEGYTLRLPGQQLYRAIVAGTLTDRWRIEPFAVGTCPGCDGQLSAAYHPDHLLTVECPACETLFDALHFPANGLEDRSEADVLDAAYQRRHHKVATMRRGVCPECGGTVARALRDGADVTAEADGLVEAAGLEIYATLACSGCHTSLIGHPANLALATPPVVGFFTDHDRDVARMRWWDEPIAAARDTLEVVDDDPVAVALRFDLDGDRLAITLDDTLQVVEADRTGPTAV